MRLSRKPLNAIAQPLPTPPAHRNHRTMSSPTALYSRLKELSAALGQIHPLVNRLRNFTTAVGQGDEARLELGTEIHTLLKEAEEQMELLRVKVEALESSMEHRRKAKDSEKEAEKERVVVLAGRLTEDLRRWVSLCLHGCCRLSD